MTLSAHALLALLGGAIYFSPAFPYALSVLKKQTRPSIVTWLGWSILVGIALAAQIAKGPSWSLVIPIASEIMNVSMTILTLKYGSRIFTKIDILLLVLAGVALLAWMATAEPLSALGLSLLADLIVCIPTFVKTWRDPASEPALYWLLYAVGAGLGAVASAQDNIANLAFPLYSLVVCGSIGILALRNHPMRRARI